MTDKRMQEEKYAQLCDEIRDWCEKHKLPHLSADELLCELCELPMSERSDEEQAKVSWLSDFITRWDAVDSDEED